LEQNIIAFADDLLIYANSQAQLEYILSKVTRALAAHNMYLAKEKSQLIRNRMHKDSSIAGIKQIATMKYLGVGISASKLSQRSAVVTNFKKACGELWRVTRSTGCKTRTILMRAYLDSVIRYQLGPMMVAGVIDREFVEKLETKMYRTAFVIPRYT
jgi:hypothetical protein